MPTAADSISIVVVNWNSKDDTSACLASIAAQTDRHVETILVDNGSEDGSVAHVRREFPWVRVVETGENLGFAEGVNRGIEVATGEWIFTLNNDAVADRELVAKLKQAAREAESDVGMIQARIVFKQRPDRINSTGIVLYPDGRCEDRDFDAPVRDDDRASEIFCPTAGAALYRRAMLDRVKLPTGWLDRTFFMYAEDVDLGWRCRVAGWKSVYVPDAFVLHAFQGSSQRHGSSFVDRMCRTNRLRLLVKNASKRFLVRSLPRTAIDVVHMVKRDGLATLPAVARATTSALAQRRDVTRLARVRRSDVERRWVTTKR